MSRINAELILSQKVCQLMGFVVSLESDFILQQQSVKESEA